LNSTLTQRSSSLSDTVNEVEELSEKIIESSGEAKSKLYSRLQQVLINLQDFNDEKIRYNQHLSELIETRFRSVERDFQNNIASKTERPQSPAISSASSTARNASIVQQVLSNLPLKNSSTTGSNISSSTNNSASEHNATANGTEKGVKRARRTRNETTAAAAELERAETPVKIEIVSCYGCCCFLIYDLRKKTNFIFSDHQGIDIEQHHRQQQQHHHQQSIIVVDECEEKFLFIVAGRCKQFIKQKEEEESGRQADDSSGCC
jgi:hypothetical protein